MSEPHTTLKPRKNLLIISSVVLILWVGVLIWMYVKWVWPTRTGGMPTTVQQTH